jgi:hypothetical protein
VGPAPALRQRKDLMKFANDQHGTDLRPNVTTSSGALASELYALAAATFDIDANGQTIASLGRSHGGRQPVWVAELLRDEFLRPPFTAIEHSSRHSTKPLNGSATRPNSTPV